MTLRRLKDFAVNTQFKLGLAHWIIETRWMTKEEIKEQSTSRKTCHGFANWDEQNTTAEIAIRKGCPNFHKGTVLHELLHIRIDGHKPCTRASVTREVCINALEKLYLEVLG